MASCEGPAMPLVRGPSEVLGLGLGDVGDGVGLAEVGDGVGLADVGDGAGDGLGGSGEADWHGPPGDGITLLCAADEPGAGTPEWPWDGLPEPVSAEPPPCGLPLPFPLLEF